jgi:hypothetical protein
MELGYRKKAGDWSYDFNINLSHTKNEAIDLGGRDLTTNGIKKAFLFLLLMDTKQMV